VTGVFPVPSVSSVSRHSTVAQYSFISSLEYENGSTGFRISSEIYSDPTCRTGERVMKQYSVDTCSSSLLMLVDYYVSLRHIRKVFCNHFRKCIGNFTWNYIYVCKSAIHVLKFMFVSIHALDMIFIIIEN
jgi:hypothetical protein